MAEDHFRDLYLRLKDEMNAERWEDALHTAQELLEIRGVNIAYHICIVILLSEVTAALGDQSRAEV